MASEEITQPQKLSDLMDAGGGWGIFDCFEPVSTWLNTLFCESEA